jgi:hypothetical protein
LLRIVGFDKGLKKKKEGKSHEEFVTSLVVGRQKKKKIDQSKTIILKVVTYIIYVPLFSFQIPRRNLVSSFVS